MSNEYTYYIEDGSIATAKDFIMLCANEFVPFRYRIIGGSVIPNEIQSDGKQEEWLREEQERLDMYQSMTIDEAQRIVDMEYEQRVKEYEAYIQRRDAQKERYHAMIESIKGWNAPTVEHNKLKKFAIEQLEGLINEIPSAEYDQLHYPKKQDAGEWLKEKIRYSTWSVQDRKSVKKREEERVEHHNWWLNELRDSLATLDE